MVERESGKRKGQSKPILISFWSPNGDVNGNEKQKRKQERRCKYKEKEVEGYFRGMTPALMLEVLRGEARRPSTGAGAGFTSGFCSSFYRTHQKIKSNKDYLER
jgi:hypothetical protein